MDYVNHVAPTDDVRWLHTRLDVFDDAEVEIHFMPSYLECPWHNRALQRFFESEKEACFAIDANTDRFNQVFILAHAFRHLFSEGVGMRQLMDYYFVIQASNPEDINKCQKMVESLGLNRFASALMWVLMHVFGLKVEQALWAPCEKDGRLLLDEILMSGNFGHTDERAKDILTSRWKAFWFVNSKTFRFWRFDHWAWFWSPVWRVYHFLWRKMKGFK